MQKTRIVVLIGALLALLISGSAWGECRLSVKDVQTQINHDGPKKALWDFFEDWKGHWGPLMNCVSTGERAWLDIAAELAPYSDAGASEDLNIYVGKALAVNAENVLRTKFTSGGIEGFCAFLDNDPPSDMTDSQLTDWYLADLNSRLTGLARVHSPDLVNDVARCRNEIQDEINYQKTHAH